jgi:hypothetical protein
MLLAKHPEAVPCSWHATTTGSTDAIYHVCRASYSPPVTQDNQPGSVASYDRLRDTTAWGPGGASGSEWSSGMSSYRKAVPVTTVNLGFTQLRARNSAHRAQIRAIYEEAFPPNQRAPFDELIAGARKDGRFFVVVTDAAGLVGFAAVPAEVSRVCLRRILRCRPPPARPRDRRRAVG